MDIDITPLTAVATLAALLLAPAVSVLFDGWRGHPPWRSIPASSVVALSAAVGWMLVWSLTRPELDPRLVIPIAGLAGLGAVLTTVPLGRRPLVFVSIVAAIWTALVFSPAAIALFSATDGILGSALRTLDLGGACAVLVTAGCGLATLLVVLRPARADESDIPRSIVVAVFGAVWLLWILWLVGLELVIDEITARIIVNAVIAPVASASGWLVVQRLRRGRTTVSGAVCGLFCGLVAVTAGCGYLDPLGATLTGVIAGVSCSLIGYGLVRRTGSAVWLLVAVLVAGASIGVILLGAFATRSGLMFTGQPEVLFSQSASVALVIAYATVVSFAIWSVVRLIDVASRRPATSRPS